MLRFLSKTAPIIVFMLNIACVEFSQIDLPGEEPRLVVEALLSDRESFSRVYIGWSYSSVTQCGVNYDQPFVYECEADTMAVNPKVTGAVKIVEENGVEFIYNFKMADRKGFFQLPLKNSTVGVPGKKYTMDVEVNYAGQTSIYHAESVMLATPPITSITYEIRKGEIGKSDDFVPLISFQEPFSTKDYYLFTLCGYIGRTMPSNDCVGNNRVWNYSVLSDTYLPSNVINLSVDNGATVAKYADFYPNADPGYTNVEVHMYSVDKVTYEFYKSLLTQFNNDGGAYTPAPSSAAGNFSNGAIGIFSAVQLSYARVGY